MKFSLWLRDKIFDVAMGISVGIFLVLLFMAARLPASIIIMFVVIALLYLIAVLAWDYLRKRTFYNELFRNVQRLDQKYLVLEMMEQPGFYEGDLLMQLLYDIDKSMNENVAEYRMHNQNFKEYIEMWIHEVKIPIASLRLMCHNHQDVLESKYVRQIRRLDALTTQVIYYVRAENASKDYRITEVSLQDIARSVAMNNKDDLLENEISFSVENMDRKVVTDAKWMEFILNQLVNNSIKYKRTDSETCAIRIWAEEESGMTVIHVWDNGIGIPDHDLPRVFQKSFTGENGRRFVKSTGMGLYIVHSLCKELGHSITIHSEKDKYTECKIAIAGNSHMQEIYGE